MAEEGRRLWLAPVVVSVIAVTSFVLYNTAPTAVANLVIVPYVLSLVLGPSFIYPVLRRRGATLAGSVLASLLVPAVWLLKECYNFSAVYGFWETVFYAFNPISLGVFIAAAFQMAVWELVLRRSSGQKGRALRRPALITTGILILVVTGAVVGRDNGGREIFYAYIALYSYLFGAS